MSFLPRALRTRLENIADTPGLEAFVTELQLAALRRGGTEISAEGLAWFVLQGTWFYRVRALRKAYRVDLKKLPSWPRSEATVSTPALTPDCVQILNSAATFAARTGRTPEQLRFSDVLVALAQSHLTAPLMENLGLTKLRILYFMSHRRVLPDEVELALPPIDRRKPVWVRIQNDDFTPMDAVNQILSTVFGLDQVYAQRTMMKVHEEGQAFLGPFEHELACDLATRATMMARLAQHPLLLTLTRSENQSLFARHWRGELPLAESLKRVVLRGTAYFLAPASILLGYVFMKLPPQAVRVAVYALACIAAAFITWQWTGLWRAASRSTHRWKVIGARVLVHGTICLLVLGAAAVLPTLATRLRVLANSIQEIASLPPLAITAAERDALYVRGGIGQGAARQLELALQEHPQVRFVVLESPGGLASEGIRMGRVIRERGLNTFVESDCASACTLAFLGGVKRYLSVEGRLGFHQGRSMFGPTFLDGLQAKAFLRNGVPPWFVDRVQRTPYTSIWIPTEQELIDAGVVNEVWD
ncbi:MAG TPA: ATP-dependent Clp protease adaptor ClpS [Steroidobacteraceae bacterium]|nr:ATP-dependent Clp protease adaptor ClpS [Steroidobacteraceae bacterium]